MKLKKDNNDYSEEYVRKNRTFPTRNTVILVILVIVQIVLGVLAFLYEPRPQDIIEEYNVTVEPLEDGSLDIEYHFLWKAIDTSEDLTWVEIGMANPDFTVYNSSVSRTISSHLKVVEGDYVAIRLDFIRPYRGGETLQFSFKVNQKRMLCHDGSGYFYEFIPGWFNSTPVEQYNFRWKKTDDCLSAPNARQESGYYIWSGSFDCGGYNTMSVRYTNEAFKNMDTVLYSPFDSSGAYNELSEDKTGIIAIACLFIALIIIIEVYIIDSYVSYGRGRGFLYGYGHRIHIYGRPNPRYERERAKHAAAAKGGGRGFGGGGCACACACACAGGGRAGCSQKDTYTNMVGENE